MWKKDLKEALEENVRKVEKGNLGVEDEKLKDLAKSVETLKSVVLMLGENNASLMETQSEILKELKFLKSVQLKRLQNVRSSQYQQQDSIDLSRRSSISSEQGVPVL